MPKKRTRAANGMGTVRQRKDGRWEGRYTSPDGRQRSVYASTEAEVTKKLRTALHDVDRGAWREPSKMTVADWLKIWLKDYQAHTSPQTVRSYTDHARLHINPVIGDVKLVKVSPLHIRRVISDMTARGLSPTYARHCQAVLVGAFNGALEAGLIKVNPASGVKAPRRNKPEYSIVDRENIPAFVEAAKESQYGLAIIFLLMTGLRVGEERGLKWTDIDMDAASMRVERQLTLSGAPAFTPPKDGSSRTIELTREAVDLLRQRRIEQAEARLAAGDRWQAGAIVDDLIFRTPHGHYLSESTIQRSVRAIGEKIGLPKLHPHDLRHSYAVAALRSGIDVKTVQNNLGHKSATMTLDTYAAYTSDAGKVGAERFSAYWSDALKNAD